jgi:hypothetical protein
MEIVGYSTENAAGIQYQMLKPKLSILLFILSMSFTYQGLSQQNPTVDPPTAAPQTVAGEDSLNAEALDTSPSTNNDTKTHPLTELSDPALRDQQHWLTVGDQLISSLYLSQVGGDTHGGVLLIPNLNMRPSEQGIINSLRNALPESHWHTLALNLSNKGPYDEQLVSQSIAAGVKFLNDEGIYNIAIIAEGAGAAQAIHFLADSSPVDDVKLQSVRALIIIAANNNVPGSDIKTLEKLSTIELPILDAYSAHNYSQRQLADARKRAMHKTKVQSVYRQITLPNQVNYYRKNENHITKRIRGWMDKNISGFTVEKRRM